MGLRGGASARRLDAGGALAPFVNPRVNARVFFGNKPVNVCLFVCFEIGSRFSKFDSGPAHIIVTLRSSTDFSGLPAGGKAREIEIASALDERGLEACDAHRLWARSTTYVKKEKINEFLN